MKTYSVGIPKFYFPKELWPSEGFDEIYELVKVRASNRTEAAHLAWKKHGDKWMQLMRDDFIHRAPGKLRPKISLYVNQPDSIMQGTLTRLSPVSIGEI